MMTTVKIRSNKFERTSCYYPLWQKICFSQFVESKKNCLETKGQIRWNEVSVTLWFVRAIILVYYQYGWFARILILTLLFEESHFLNTWSCLLWFTMPWIIIHHSSFINQKILYWPWFDMSTREKHYDMRKRLFS